MFNPSYNTFILFLLFLLQILQATDSHRHTTYQKHTLQAIQTRRSSVRIAHEVFITALPQH